MNSRMKKICLKETTNYFSNFHKSRFTSETLRRLREIRGLREGSLLEREERFVCMMCLEVWSIFPFIGELGIKENLLQLRLEEK